MINNLQQPFPAAEGFIRGRSYNIKIDDQTLLRFSPKNSDSTYYFGDMVRPFSMVFQIIIFLLTKIHMVFCRQIGGTLTFFHGGFRRCLEV